jgi:hypothetical protein
MTCPNDLLDSLRWAPQEAHSKVCSSCHETLPLDSFSSSAAAKDGKQWWCKSCARAYWGARPKIKASLDAVSATCSQTHSLDEPPVCSSDEFAVTQELTPDALYIMENPRITGEIKIGRSRDPEERAKQLCAGQNYRMVVRRTWGEKGFLEKTIHHKLKRRRVEEGAGVEWFQVSVEQAETIIAAAIIEDDISRS